MRSTMLLLLGTLAARVHAQDPVPPPAPTAGESVAATVPLASPPPNPLQDRYLKGLRTAGRGVAQIKDGIDRVVRAQSVRDTLRVRQAAKRLGGLCTAARGFITSGRGQMEPTAYEPPTRQPAKAVVSQLDSLAVSAKACQTSAGKTPTSVTADLQARLRGYEAAVAAFRTAIGLSNRQ
jgi:hypothetical protein